MTLACEKLSMPPPPFWSSVCPKLWKKPRIIWFCLKLLHTQNGTFLLLLPKINFTKLLVLVYELQITYKSHNSYKSGSQAAIVVQNWQLNRLPFMTWPIRLKRSLLETRAHNFWSCFFACKIRSKKFTILTILLLR